MIEAIMIAVQVALLVPTLRHRASMPRWQWIFVGLAVLSIALLSISLIMRFPAVLETVALAGVIVAAMVGLLVVWAPVRRSIPPLATFATTARRRRYPNYKRRTS